MLGKLGEPHCWHGVYVRTRTGRLAPESYLSFMTSAAGPMLDMGPYYVTALVNLLGPVKACRSDYDQRGLRSESQAAKR